MKKALLYLAVWIGFLSLTSCSSGYIYTHVTRPLDINYSCTPTPLDKVVGKGDVKHFRYYIEIDWDSNAIGDIARKHGIETLYYADLETISVLRVWRQKYVHLYGR